MKVTNVVCWNRKYYGISKKRNCIKYFKSDNSQFDDSTEEISADEFFENAEKYAKIFSDLD